MHVTVWGRKPAYTGQARLVKRALDELGYRTSLRLASETRFDAAFQSAPRRERQVGTIVWVADFPTASDFLGFVFSCPINRAFDLNLSEFCTARTRRLMMQALRLQATDPTGADNVWTTVDREIVDQAAAVPLYNPKAIDVVSRRVGNYQRNPQWGVLLDQLWLR